MQYICICCGEGEKKREERRKLKEAGQERRPATIPPSVALFGRRKEEEENIVIPPCWHAPLLPFLLPHPMFATPPSLPHLPLPLAWVEEKKEEGRGG